MEALFGISINPAAGRLDEAFRLAEAADTGGLDLVGLQDHPYNGSFADTWTLLSVIGARTSRVKLMTNVANLPLRHPALLAKAAATLDILTGGRVELGVGAGAFWEGIESFGVPRRSPREAVEAFEEALNIIRMFLDPKTDTVSFRGKHYVLKDAQAGPKPKHPIRVWVGGYGKRMLELAGRLADGLTVSLPYLGPDQLPSRLRLLRRAAQRAGRDPSTIMVNYNLGGTILVGEDATRVIMNVKGGVVATAEQWVKVFVELARLGVNSFVFWPTGQDRLGQVRLYVETVVPKAREALRQLGA